MRRLLMTLTATTLAFAGTAVAAPKDLPEARDGILAAGAVDSVLPPGTEMVVELLEPGAQPRRTLRYSMTSGMVLAFEDSVEVKAKMTAANAAPQEGGLPLTGRKMTVRVLDAGTAGAELEIGVNGSGSIRCRASPTGHLTEIATHGLPAPTGFQASIVVFPEDEIGIGGRWRVVRHGTGDTTLHVDTYTLLSRAGNSVELSTSTWQALLSSKQRAPGGGEVVVRHYEASGQAHVTIDLTAIVPQEEKGTLSQTMDFKVATDMRLDSVTTMTAKSAKTSDR